MNLKTPHIIPFGALLEDLKHQGFELGVDTHIRVQTYLNRCKDDDLETVKIKLGALIAHSEAEQALFYRMFDAYVERYSFKPKKEKDDTSSFSPDQKRRRFASLLFTIGFLILLTISWFYIQSLKGVTANFVHQQVEASQEIFFKSASEFFQFRPIVKDSIVSIEWKMGDGTELSGEVVSHTYKEAGIYNVQLNVQGLHDVDSIIFPIQVRPTLGTAINAIDLKNKTYELKADYFFNEKDSNVIDIELEEKTNETFRNRKNNYATRLSLIWDLGDGIVIDQRRINSPVQSPSTVEFIRQSVELDTIIGSTSLQHTFEPGDYSVKLTTILDLIPLQGELEPLTYTAQAQRQLRIEAEELPVEVPPVPIKYKELIKEDISDLLKDKKAQYWPLWITLAYLVIWLLYEIYQWYSRKLVLDSLPKRGPPLKQELRMDRPSVNLFGSETFDLAAQRLRERREGDHEELDIEESIKRTLDEGGMPTMEWRKSERASHYLFLIEEQSYKDHQAIYFDELVRELNERDISAERYFFDEDPAICWKDRAQPDTEISLERLISEYATYRLVVIGEGKGLVDLLSGKLAPWAEDFTHWTTRAWLSTRPTEAWGSVERQLEQRFLLMPATEQGFLTLVDQWEKQKEGQQTLSLRYWQQHHTLVTPPSVETENLIPELKHYLGPQTFQWLCACAVYPELYWELTLACGELVRFQPDLAQKGQSSQALDSLYRLLQIPFFRQGQIPHDIRLQLVAEIDEELAKEVRRHIIGLLKQERNQAASHTYARQDQESTLAIYEYLNSKQDKQAKDELKADLEKIDPNSLRDIVSVQAVSNIRSNPLAIELPRSFFRGGIPLYGMRTNVQRLMWLIPIVLFWLVFLWVKPKPFVVEDVPEPYALADLELANVKDSVKWLNYIAWHLDSLGEKDQALDSLNKSFRLVPLNRKPYNILPTFNLINSYFNQSLNFYQEGLYTNSLSVFPNIPPNLLLKDSVPLIFRDFIQSEFADNHYLIGLAQIYNNSLIDGVRELTHLPQEYFEDFRASNSYQKMRTAGAYSNLTRLLQQLFAQQQDEALKAQIIALLDRLGSGIPAIDQLLEEARAFYAQRQWQQALDRYGQVLLQLPTNEEALERKEICEENIRDELIRDLLSEGGLLLASQQYESAKQKFQEVLDLDPRNNQALSGLNECNSHIAVKERENIPEEIDTTNQPIITQNVDSLRKADSIRLADSLKQAGIPTEPPSPAPPPWMILVKGGSFMMGSTVLNLRSYKDERPRHEVILSDFQISAHEITNAQYVDFLNDQASAKPDSVGIWIDISYSEIKTYNGIYWVEEAFKNHPVRYVSWYGAKAYCQWAGGRLPTEAEWEYAARGGQLSKGYEYAGSNDIDEVDWYRSNSGGKTHPVGMKKPNELGIYDMSGNVREWCSDWWDNEYYSKSPRENPKGPISGTSRVVRGGSWGNVPQYRRVAYRYYDTPGFRYSNLGFRLARNP